MRSFDLGSVRLTRRFVTGDPLRARGGRAEIRAEIVEALDAADAAAAADGARDRGNRPGDRQGRRARRSARPSSHSVVEDLIETPTRGYAKRYRIDPARVRCRSPAGAVLLAEVQALLETPLVVARGGLREGAVLELLDRVEAAAA